MPNVLLVAALLSIVIPLLIFSIKRPYVFVFILVVTIWISPLSAIASFSEFTPNRILGLAGLGIIIANKALRIDPEKKLSFSSFDYAVWIYILIILVSLLTNHFSVASANLLGDILTGYLLYWIALNTIRTRETFDALLRVIVFSSAILSVAIIIEGFRSIGFVGQRFGGLLQVNQASSEIIATIPIIVLFIVEKRSRILKILLAADLVASILAVFLTGSRTGLLFLAIVLFAIALWYVRRPSASKFAVMVVIGAGVFFGYGILLNYFPQILGRGLNNIIPSVVGQTNVYDPRYDLQRFSWQIFLSHPLLGVGLGNETYISLVFGGGIRDHNFFTGALAETGILGLLAGIIVFATVLRMLINCSRSPLLALPGPYIPLLGISFTLFCVVDLAFHGTLGLANKAWFVIALVSVLAPSLPVPKSLNIPLQ